MAKIADMQEVSLDLLKPYERNAKIHGEDQIGKLMDSIREFGFLSPCIVERGTYNLIAGHGRIEAAKRLGMETVPCVFVEDITEEQRKAYILADNRLTELGEWDAEMVSEELKALKERGFDIDLTGFDIDAIIFEDDPAEWEETETEGVPSDAITAEGDLWQLGDHRLLVGDSTDPRAVDRLMGGEIADLLITDPPYNVALGVGDTPEIAKKRRRRTDGLKIENDAMETDEFEDFLAAAFSNARDHMKAGGAFYCWYASTTQKTFQTALERVGLIPHQILIWVKQSLVLGRQDYQWRHEPCFYGWTEGAGHYFIDARSLTTVWDDLEDLTREEAIERIKRLCEATTTLYEDKPAASDLHPTMKPVGLFKKQIRNSSREGEIVLDLFGGSGTTIIACEQLGRRARVMELDPRYATAIIRRWEEETGRKAVLLNA